jgi:hypothetical protein
MEIILLSSLCITCYSHQAYHSATESERCNTKYNLGVETDLFALEFFLMVIVTHGGILNNASLGYPM